MPKTTKGHANCPECNDTQAVQFDGKKYFISCTNWRTFTSYQSKTAIERIQQRLAPIAEPETPPEPQPERVESTPAIKTNAKPYKPVATKSFLDSLNEDL